MTESVLFKSKGVLFLWLILFLLPVSILAQVHRFVYNLDFKGDSMVNHTYPVSMYLEVGRDNVSYFDTDLYKTDSLNRSKNDAARKPTYRFESIWRSLGSDKNENYVFAVGKYFSFPSVDSIKWHLDDERKSYESFVAQKATAYFGGRHWIAWFTNEIPFSEGPYKFRGLPGLVVEVYDTKENFHFRLVESYEISGRAQAWNPGDLLGRPAIPITLKKYQQLLLNDYNNPFSDVRAEMMTGMDVTLAAFGHKIKTPEQLNEITRLQQEQIRKSYNPIELDKAVKYK